MVSRVMLVGAVIIALSAVSVFAGHAVSNAQGEDDTMSSEVSWMYAVTIKAGQVDALRGLIAEMASRAEANEPGTLEYHWTISEDGTTGHLRERYESSEAALTHLASFNANFADRLMPLLDSAQMFVNGDPSPALRQEIAGAQPTYMVEAGGFIR